MGNYKRSINSFRLAASTACYCESCRILMAYGVNSVDAMNAMADLTGRPTFGSNWEKLLKDHEAYHVAKGEELPEEWTAKALTPEFKASLCPPKPAAPKVMTEEELALYKFQLLARPKVRQLNERAQRPVVDKLDSAELKW